MADSGAVQNMQAGQYRDHVIAAVALVAVAAVSIIGFCGLAWTSLRRRSDPARKAVSWIKTSFFLLTLYVLFFFCFLPEP